MGELGYNPGSISDCDDPNDVDYDCRFGGTSAACPIVAGVASLILAKDSNLTSEEVGDIIRNSAVTDLDWGTITPPDDEYGYGRVDAFRAVLSISHGDTNNDGIMNLQDITRLIDAIYLSKTPLFPSQMIGDVNCDGVMNLQDVTRLSGYLYQGADPPVKPCFVFELQ